MNDYWNDPPETPELPECCGEIMDINDKGIAFCSTCGKILEPEPDIEPMPEEPINEDLIAGPAKCPHDKEWDECDACLHASDLAYDTARENRNKSREN